MPTPPVAPKLLLPPSPPLTPGFHLTLTVAFAATSPGRLRSPPHPLTPAITPGAYLALTPGARLLLTVAFAATVPGRLPLPVPVSRLRSRLLQQSWPPRIGSGPSHPVQRCQSFISISLTSLYDKSEVPDAANWTAARAVTWSVLQNFRN